MTNACARKKESPGDSAPGQTLRYRRQFTLPEGEWEALLLNEMIEPDSMQPLMGEVTVEGRTVLLVRAY